MATRKLVSLRSSILLEILAALGVILVISIGVRSILEARLVDAALTRQSHELASGRLAILANGYSLRERLLDTNLRTIAERLDAEGLTLPSRRNELIADLGRTARSLNMGLLQVVGPSAPDVAGVPRSLERSQLELVQQIEDSGRSGLVPTSGGPKVQALAVPIGVTGNLLVGGYDFSNAFAYDMRSQIGDDGQTILVADGQVAGSTLATPPETIPGKRQGDETLPSTPVTVPGRDDTLVAYVAIGGSGRPTTSGALGVILQDPVATLNESLVNVRLFSSAFSIVVAFLLGWVLFRRLIRPLVGLSETAGRIVEGQLDAHFTAPRKDEIGKLAESLQRMTRELQEKTRRLQAASRRLVGVQEEERRRLARDLHDGMQQQVVALAIKLRHAAGRGASSPALLDSLADDAEEAAFALQELGRGISSTVLADQGLYSALRAAAGRSPLQVILEVPSDLRDTRFMPDTESTLYHVAMEAMANAQKHAPGALLTVELARTEQDLLLRISDDGPGFDLTRSKHGAGLQNMRDRVSAHGGSIMMISRLGGGTRIVCRLPLPALALAGGGALPEVDEDRRDTPVEVGLL